MLTDPEVGACAPRRNFTADGTVKILVEYDAAWSALERTALARRTGVHSSWSLTRTRPNTARRKRENFAYELNGNAVALATSSTAR